MTNALSLFVIEDGLAELLLAREDALSDMNRIAGLPNPKTEDEAQQRACDFAEAKQGLAVIDQTLQEYLTAEVRKVDNYHRFFTAAEHLMLEIKTEEDRAKRRRKRLERAMDWLKARTLEVMERSGKKRLDGTAGRYLLSKANGGLAPLQIDGWDQEAERWLIKPEHRLLPESVCETYVRIRTSAWEAACDAMIAEGIEPGDVQVITVKPNNTWVRDALNEPCKECNGNRARTYPDTAIGHTETCRKCGGAGTEPVPGARLLERGKHLEVK